MNAYKVYYQTGGKSTAMIVLAEDETGVEVAVASKDKDYRIGSRWCKFNVLEEVPLSNVMISDLSVIELLMLVRKQND